MYTYANVYLTVYICKCVSEGIHSQMYVERYTYIVLQLARTTSKLTLRAWQKDTRRHMQFMAMRTSSCILSAKASQFLTFAHLFYGTCVSVRSSCVSFV